MTPAARYAALIEIMDLLHQEWAGENPRPAEQVLKSYTAQRRYIGGGDRRHLQEALFTLLRGYGVAKAGCEATTMPLTGRSIVLMHLAQRGADIAAFSDGSKYAPERVTDEEWATFKAQSTKHKAQLPEWLERLLQQQYGAETDALINALLQPAPLDLRVNLLKTTPEKALAALKSEGIEATPIPWLEAGLSVAGRSAPVTNTDAFKKGWVEIQDRGSQAVIETLLGYLESAQNRTIETAQGAARSGRGSVALGGQAPHKISILDYCAGAGGKSLALASALGNHAEIIAWDIHAERLAELEPRAARAGAKNITVWRNAPESLPLADIVLLDVPCSGTGTLRRHPDLAWRTTENKISEYSLLQRNILRKGAEKLRPGGVLIYVTCSLLETENFQSVNAFLTEFSDFRVANLPDLWNKDSATKVQMLRFLPHSHGSDGFFMAVLKHQAETSCFPAKIG